MRMRPLFLLQPFFKLFSLVSGRLFSPASMTKHEKGQAIHKSKDDFLSINRTNGSVSRRAVKLLIRYYQESLRNHNLLGNQSWSDGWSNVLTGYSSDGLQLENLQHLQPSTPYHSAPTFLQKRQFGLSHEKIVPRIRNLLIRQVIALSQSTKSSNKLFLPSSLCRLPSTDHRELVPSRKVLLQLLTGGSQKIISSYRLCTF